MRITLLTAAYPSPADPQRAVYVENLARCLREGDGTERLEITVVAPRVHRSDPQEELRDGLRVRRFQYPSGDRRLKEIQSPTAFLLLAYFVSGLAATLSEIQRSAPHALLAHWVLPCGPMARLACAAHGIPYLLAAHGSDLNKYGRSSRALRLLARESLRKATLVLPVSADLRRIVEGEFDVPPEKIRVAPMGVDDRFFDPRSRIPRSAARAKIGLPEEMPALLYVGDLTAEKGVPELLQAHQGLRAGGLPAELVIVGDGPLRAGGAPEGFPGVRFLGKLPQASLRELYAAADLFVLPSRSEGAPVTIMEALCAGLPVVASSVGGIPDLLEGGAFGSLVPPGSARALEAALADLLRSPGALETLRARLAVSPRDFSCARRAREVFGFLCAALGTGAPEAGGVNHGA